MSLSIPIRRFSGESNKPDSCKCIGLSNDGISPVLETEITMFTYGMAVNGTGSTFERSRKLLMPSLLPGASYYLDAVYLNQQVGLNFDMGLVAPDASTAAILSMAPTGAGAGINSLTRFRSTTSFTLSQDGVYQLHLYTTNNQGIPYAFKLIPVQSQGRSTVIHFPLMVGKDPRYADTGGIAGGDLFRTTSQTYVEGDSFSGTGASIDLRFPYFYYLSSEWVGLQAIYLEVLSSGFANSQYAALFNVASGNMVTGSEVINASSNFHTEYSSFGATALTDGLYVIKVHSGTPAANSFFYGAWLHFVVGGSDPNIKGNCYYKVSNGSEGNYRTKPPASENALLEACYRGGGGATTYILGCGTTDVGAGTKINATEYSISTDANEKHLTRSPIDIEPYLTAGNRFYAFDLGAQESQSFLVKPFRC